MAAALRRGNSHLGNCGRRSEIEAHRAAGAVMVAGR
jgi:hypothetical protein